MNLCPHCFGEEIADNVCPRCGFIPGADDTDKTDELALPLGTLIAGGQYTIGGILGQGGFGITYFGYDNNFKTRVAVKEYYPEGFALRKESDSEYTVRPRKSDKTGFFERGLRRFEDEARRLLRFSKSPGFVSVRNLITERGTAYIIMEFIDGEPLKSVIGKMGGKLSEKQTLELFLPIIKTLGEMHNAGIIHRDIAPDNIMVQRDGKAVLIDLGSSIELTEENSDSKSTVAIVKHGYAAEELYDRNHARQGTWSDVYSIAAAMYNALTGETPPDALDRLRETPLPDITEPVSESVKAAIIHGMAIKPQERIQTMEELYTELTAVGADTIRPQTPEDVMIAANIEPEPEPPNSENLRASFEEPQTDYARDLPAGAAPPAPPQNIDITNKFPDPVFRAEIRKRLGLNPKDPIMSLDVANITEFIYKGYGRPIREKISSLEGLENFVSLKKLSCGGNNLKTLPELPNSLSVLWCSDNHPKLDVKNAKFKDGTTVQEALKSGRLPSTLLNGRYDPPPRPKKKKPYAGLIAVFGVMACVLIYALSTYEPVQETAGVTTPAAMVLTAMTTPATTTAPNIDITDEIPDEIFKREIRETLGLETDDPIMSYDVAGITEFIYLGLALSENSKISSLDGLQYFSSLKKLNVGYNTITTLPELPDSLDELHVSNNKLGVLPKLPDSLRILDASYNNLLSLPSLPVVLTSLRVQDNILKALPDLPDSLIELSCSINNLTTLPDLPDSLTYLSASQNAITSLPELPDSATEINVYKNNLTNIPTLPDSLTWLNIGKNPALDIETVKFKDGTTALEREAAGTLDLLY